MTHLFPIPSPLPEGWRVVTARTQAECDAAFAVRCRLDTILVIEPRESINVKLDCILFGNRGGLGSINGEIVRFYGIRWLIVQGGESPCHPDWVRSLQNQAEAAGVPFAFLSWGAWKPLDADIKDNWYESLYKPRRKAKVGENQNAIDESYGRTCRVPTMQLQHDGKKGFWAIDGHVSMQMFRVGPSRSGRLLDDREWSQVPEELQR